MREQTTVAMAERSKACGSGRWVLLSPPQARETTKLIDIPYPKGRRFEPCWRQIFVAFGRLSAPRCLCDDAMPRWDGAPQLPPPRPPRAAAIHSACLGHV